MTLCFYEIQPVVLFDIQHIALCNSYDKSVLYKKRYMPFLSECRLAGEPKKFSIVQHFAGIRLFLISALFFQTFKVFCAHSSPLF